MERLKEREAKYADLEVCEDGHVVKHGASYMVTQVINHCGHWTSKHGNYCEECGSRVVITEESE